MRWFRLDVLFWGVPLALWLFTLYFTYKYATNVPYSDAWLYPDYVVASWPATPRDLWAYLWTQHNEHRIVWDSLFQLLLVRYTAWNQYLAAFPGVLFLGAGNLCFLWHVSRRYPELPQLQRLLLLGTLSLWLFNFRQHELLTENMVACLGLLHLTFVLYSNRFRQFAEHGRGAIILGFLLVVGALCVVHGLALCAFTILFVATALVVRHTVRKAHIVLASFALLLPVVYFTGWQTVPNHPSVLDGLHRPYEAALFLFALIGHPFAATPFYAIRIGIGILLLAMAGLAVAIAADGGTALWRLLVQYPLLFITGITILGTMVGRVGFGIQQAGASRYVPMGALFAATTLLLVFDTLPRLPLSLRRVFIASIFCLTIPVWYVNYREAVVAGWTRRTVLNAYRDCVLAHQDSPESCDDRGALLPVQHKRTLDRLVKMLRDHRMSFFAHTP
jgi:hypothetical protein